jgi:hypothetical protein
MGESSPEAHGRGQAVRVRINGFFLLSTCSMSVKYTGRVSIDSAEWQEVGTHTILNKDGRLGFTAISGEKGVENPAEFDDFVVKSTQ